MDIKVYTNLPFMQQAEAQEEGQEATVVKLYAVTHRHKDGTSISESAERQIVRHCFCFLF